jgi:hypothetical protein
VIEQVLTNSSATTTVLQQTSGLSSSDWISLFSAVAMVAVTIALAYYARVAIVEAKEGRRRDSIEKQLEKLYGPMFEIMDAAVCETEERRKKAAPREFEQIIEMHFESYQKLWNVFLSYGHYFDSLIHDSISRLLLFPVEFGYVRKYPESEFKFWLGWIKDQRQRLRIELIALS